MFKNKVVLVTGGAGFIGSHIVDRCLEMNAEKVISFDNCSGVSINNHAHLKPGARFKLVKGDLTKKEDLGPCVEEADFIFNEATSKLVSSLKNPLLDVETNCYGNLNLLELIRNSPNNPRIVHASTGSVFGDTQVPYQDEVSHKKPSTIYGINKLAAENYHLMYAKEYGVKSSILRYFHVYGPRQIGAAGVINVFLDRVLKGLPPQVCGSGDIVRCFTYVTDTANANFLLAQNNSSIGKRYNVASTARVKVADLAHMIIQKYGPPGMKPEFVSPRLGDVKNPIPDTSEIEKLGFKESITFDEGLERTKQWIANHVQNKNE